MGITFRYKFIVILFYVTLRKLLPLFISYFYGTVRAR